MITHPYPVVTQEQASKLPWNRLKNIMKSVRAVISHVDRRHGCYYCEACNEVHLEDDMYKTWAARDAAAEKIMAPMKEYFQMLKDCANKLPHQPKK